jgi:hypothetical protein
MFSCPSCKKKTLTLLQKVAASDPSYPAICTECRKGAVADQDRWVWLAWPDLPVYLLVGLMWLVTRSHAMALGITAVVFCLVMVSHLLVLPLQPAPEPADYPESIGVISGAGSDALPRLVYVACILLALGTLASVAYFLVASSL